MIRLDGYQQPTASYPLVDSTLYANGFLLCLGCDRRISIGQPYKTVAAGPQKTDGSRLYAALCVYCDTVAGSDCRPDIGGGE